MQDFELEAVRDKIRVYDCEDVTLLRNTSELFGLWCLRAYSEDPLIAFKDIIVKIVWKSEIWFDVPSITLASSSSYSYLQDVQVRSCAFE